MKDYIHFGTGAVAVALLTILALVLSIYIEQQQDAWRINWGLYGVGPYLKLCEDPFEIESELYWVTDLGTGIRNGYGEFVTLPDNCVLAPVAEER